MKKEDLEKTGQLDRVLGRDGFSPDLPAALRRSAGISLPLRLLLYIVSTVRIGQLDIVLPNGATRSFVGTEPGPHAWHGTCSRAAKSA
jgi:cyclopropane-fatty-acyl-phospholipid synthase